MIATRPVWKAVATWEITGARVVSSGTSAEARVDTSCPRTPTMVGITGRSASNAPMNTSRQIPDTCMITGTICEITGPICENTLDTIGTI
jgi:hypothetical protein